MLETCLRFGNSAVLTGVRLGGHGGMAVDPVLNPVLNREVASQGGRQTIAVGNRAVDFAESFRLYLCSVDEDHPVPADVASRCNIVSFSFSPASLVSRLQQEVVSSERPELSTAMQAAIESVTRSEARLRWLEEQLLTRLSESGGPPSSGDSNGDSKQTATLLDNDELVQQLTGLKQQVQQLEGEAATANQQLQDAREAADSYRPVAATSARCVQALRAGEALDPCYRYSIRDLIHQLRVVLQWSRHRQERDQRRDGGGAALAEESNNGESPSSSSSSSSTGIGTDEVRARTLILSSRIVSHFGRTFLQGTLERHRPALRLRLAQAWSLAQGTAGAVGDTVGTAPAADEALWTEAAENGITLPDGEEERERLRAAVGGLVEEWAILAGAEVGPASATHPDSDVARRAHGCVPVCIRGAEGKPTTEEGRLARLLALRGPAWVSLESSLQEKGKGRGAEEWFAVADGTRLASEVRLPNSFDPLAGVPDVMRGLPTALAVGALRRALAVRALAPRMLPMAIDGLIAAVGAYDGSGGESSAGVVFDVNPRQAVQGGGSAAPRSSGEDDDDLGYSVLSEGAMPS